jgi:hypothetical protein
MDFPQAQTMRMNGVEYRCFEANGPEWVNVGRFVVDYRMLFAYATWADGRLVLYQDRISSLKLFADGWEKVAKANASGYSTTKDILDAEHQLRLKLERQKDGVSLWVPVSLGGLVALETVAILVMAFSVR